MKKKIAAAILGAMLAFGVHSSPVFAETVEADGEYYMGDGTEENQVVAKERARKEALRNASEKVWVLVESFSESIDGELSRDEIRTISANVLQVINAVTHPEVVGDTIKFVCHITVSVEKDNVLNYLKTNSRGQIDDATQRIKELEAENARINAELAALKNRAAGASQSEMVEINAEIKRNEQKFTALQYTEQGENYYTKREYRKAVETLNKALELDPEYANAWAWLAAVQNDLGNTAKSIEYNEKAISIDPKNALAWNNLGVSYGYLGDVDKEIECYRKAIEFDATFIYSWQNLGRAYTRTGNFDKAIEYADKSVALAPKRAFSWIVLGEARQAKGDIQKALECFQKATALDSNSQLAWTFLGDAYLAAGNTIKAAECFNRCAEILRAQTTAYPEDALGLCNLGGVYLRLGNYSEAVNCLRKTLEMNPRFTNAWAVLGFTYFKAGNYDAALSAFNKAVELAPNNAQFRQARDALAAQLNR